MIQKLMGNKSLFQFSNIKSGEYIINSIVIMVQYGSVKTQIVVS